MKPILFCCCFLLACAQTVFSQQYVTEQTVTGKAKSAYKEGMEHVRAREYAIALGYFERALKEEPLFIDAKFQLAETHFDLRDFFKAKQYFEEGIAIDANYWPVAYLRLALSEMNIDRFEEAG